MIIQVKRELPKDTGAVRGRVYLDNHFFCYSLENRDYIFPDGKYSLMGRTSPSFKSNKVYIDVPGRTNIMFHGGNTIDASKGCVLVAYNRDGDTIQGDASNDLFKRVDGAYNAGEGVRVDVSTPAKKYIFVGGVAAVALVAWIVFKPKKRG